MALGRAAIRSRSVPSVSILVTHSISKLRKYESGIWKINVFALEKTRLYVRCEVTTGNMEYCPRPDLLEGLFSAVLVAQGL